MTEKAANAAAVEMTGAIEQQRVGRLRPQLLLEDQLDDVGERLEDAFEADAVRAVAVLDVGADLALEPHHERRRQHEHVEDDEDEAEVRDEINAGSRA
jgi:hypothetical protein